ncbi:MAG: outer membrane beta-barrel protein [Rhodothermales bacterium]|nr:outer membrane beta-barrel protein [Rhodothermales bacterium]MBO6778562.1 outer membrane beta-barrel protein [Rhodothermales bacterium]
MKDIRYNLLIAGLAIALMAPISASAQSGTEFGVDLALAVPQGAFQQNVDQTGFGINLHGGTHLFRSPLFVGIDAGIHVYGSENRYVPLSMTIPDIEARVHTTNNLAQVHGMLRLQPITGKVRPYVDGLYGVKYLYTRTSLTNEFDEEVVGSTNFDDYTVSYGVGAGLDVQVWQGAMGDDDRPGRVYLTFGARYLLGGEAEYLREGDIERELGSYSFNTTRSTVDIVQPRFGVTIAF